METRAGLRPSQFIHGGHRKHPRSDLSLDGSWLLISGPPALPCLGLRSWAPPCERPYPGQRAARPERPCASCAQPVDKSVHILLAIEDAPATPRRFCLSGPVGGPSPLFAKACTDTQYARPSWCTPSARAGIPIGRPGRRFVYRWRRPSGRCRPRCEHGTL